MAIITDKTIFYHVPKTGGSWVTAILNRLGLVKRRTEAIHDLPDLSNEWENEKFRFCFVRHPLTFYRSYWRFKIQIGWDQNSEFDISCKRDNFADFIKAIGEKYPNGWLNDLFKKYTPFVHFVGRQEYLREDLIKALHRSGEEFDITIIASRSPINVSIGPPTYYTKQLIDIVMDVEKETIKHFNYDYIPISISDN